MIYFDRAIPLYDGDCTESQIMNPSQGLENERIRRFGTDWIVVSGIWWSDGDKVWYLYERVGKDRWRYRSFGVKQS